MSKYVVRGMSMLSGGCVFDKVDVKENRLIKIEGNIAWGVEKVKRMCEVNVCSLLGYRDSGYDIVWFDEIIVGANNIDDLQSLEISIGHEVCWKIGMNFLLKVAKVETEFGNMMRVQIPNKLFMRNWCRGFCGNDVTGIPLIGLRYCDVGFKIVGRVGVKYELVVKGIRVCDDWKRQLCNKSSYYVNQIGDRKSVV